MKIAVFGLGYVGCVSVGCLAKDGHTLVGVDVNPTKVDQINRGEATIVEPGLPDLIRDGVAAGRISATVSSAEALKDCDASIICVGTPNDTRGHLDISIVHRVAHNIAQSLKQIGRYHTVLIRSTVHPGTNQAVSSTIESESGKRSGTDFDVVSNPEFLREGTAVSDFFNPPVTVAGTTSERAVDCVREIYRAVNAPVKQISVAAAESIKLVNNSWHALKVSFGNEVGVICKALGIDSHEVMELFCLDTKLNLSPYYLKPGFAYGGSCLPKDLKAFTTIAHDHYVDVPVLDAIAPSNAIHIRRLVELVRTIGARRVGILGFSFKPGTDDLRNSPIVEVAETLLGRGCEIRIFDRNVHLSNLMGTNREYIDAHLPHLSNMISNDLDSVVEHAEVVIVANREPEFESVPARWPEKCIIDLVRLPGVELPRPGGYHGIAW